MQAIPLLAIANQQINVTLDPGEFVLTFREANGCMIADVALDGVPIVSGSRCLAREPIIPYLYLQNGNFFFSTVNDALPYWDQFGLTQTLYFATDAEMTGDAGD